MEYERKDIFDSWIKHGEVFDKIENAGSYLIISQSNIYIVNIKDDICQDYQTIP
jgi:hypothetical protein